jgi:CRP-like cAMP-binding protein
MQKLPASSAEKLQALRRCSYCSGLDDDILTELVDGTQLARFARGETLFWQDEPCAGLHIIQRGSVKLFKLSPLGRELIVKVLEEGATFNEAPVFDLGNNPVNAAALEDCDVWVIQPDAIRATLRRHPAMAQAIILNLTHNLRMLVGIVEELSFYQVTNRLARLIRQTGQESISLPQNQLAAQLGTVREVVARSLRELERSGAIRVKRGQIQVVDADLLRQWAQE